MIKIKDIPRCTEARVPGLILLHMPPAIAVAGPVVGATVLFAAYVQLSPTMGKIWIRPNDKNEPTLALGNLVRLMAAPLAVWTPVGRHFWAPRQWSINWPLWVAAAVALTLHAHRTTFL